MPLGQFVEQVTKVLATCYLLSLFLPSGLEYACFALVLGDVISEVISFLYLYILYVLDKKKDPSPICRNSNSYDKRIFRLSLPIAITSYIRSGLSTLKQVLIPKGLEQSGLNCKTALSTYGVISGMAMPIIMFPSLFINSFSGLLIPEFSRYHTKKDYKRIKQVSGYILFFTAIVSTFLFFLIFIFADKLSLFFYNNIDVSFYIKILSPLVLFMYLDNVIDSILKGLDAQVSVMFINILDLIISLIVIYFVLPILGINGYILSLYISEILNFICSLGILLYRIN